jgi:hypothetical protein
MFRLGEVRLEKVRFGFRFRLVKTRESGLLIHIV